MNSIAPNKLEFSIGGYTGRGYGISLRNGKLLYRVFDIFPEYPKWEREVTPSERQWRDFKHRIDEIGVWRWQDRYHNPNVLDGTQWDLQINWSGHKIQSYGSNMYPGGSEQDWDVTPEFKALLEALMALLGGLKMI